MARRERETDRTAMECLLWSVPPEMLSTLAVKETAKDAWEAVKMMRLGVTRVQNAKATGLKKQLEAIKFGDGEDIDDFSMRLSSLVLQLGVLGVKISEPDVVRKFLFVVPKKFSQMACSTETLLDLDTLSIEELIGRLKAAEECHEQEEPEAKHTGKLLLSEEKWHARMNLREGGASSSQAGRGKQRGRGRGRGNSGARGTKNRDTSKDTCWYRGIAGHWARDCRKKKREEAHLVRGGADNDDALLMMQACTVASTPQLQVTTRQSAESCTPEVAPLSRPVAESATRPVAESEGESTPPKEHTRIRWTAQWVLPTQEESESPRLTELEATPAQQPLGLAAETRQPFTPSQQVGKPAASESSLFLVEEKAQVNLAQEGDAKEGVWYLDSGATNHMTGDRAAFAELDTSVTGFVKFGDGSTVDICGQGTVLFVCKSGEHRAITGVYYIPRLNTHIISLGQRREWLPGADRGWTPPSARSAAEEANRMYKLTARVSQPVCLAIHTGADSAWTWHARFGYLNFDSLRRLAKGGIVRGLSLVEHVNQLCDACLAGKQRRASFAQQARYRAKKRLELVHGDLCEPITPATPSGKRYFLLLVDDLTRYMWLALLVTKDEAAAAIIRLLKWVYKLKRDADGKILKREGLHSAAGDRL